MLVELAVRDLGVVEHTSLTLEQGMTALTGETGAGKTMIVEAISLLLGGRSDPGRVRPGASEAVVEGRFHLAGADGDDARDGDAELVVRRVVPASGRSRCYLNGSLATAAELAAATEHLVELHGQHAQQDLLRPKAQRDALDIGGAIDTTEYAEARGVLRDLLAQRDELGGDERARAREIDLLRYQLDELEAAGLRDADEEVALVEREDLLGDALSHREASAAAVALIAEDDAAADLVARAAAAIERHRPFAAEAERLRNVVAELGDVGAELRDRAEAIDTDPAALDDIRARRHLLVELRRKYGEQLADVIEYQRTVADQLAVLERREATMARIDTEIAAAEAFRDDAAQRLLAARVAAAPNLAAAVELHLVDVGLANATLQIDISGEAGEHVEFLLSANSSMPPRPLSKVASGGELSRVMLALHLVLAATASTLVFDEVDAGIGGATATSVGRSLARLARSHQVIVVTHLPQVAAFADQQVVVTKSDRGSVTTSAAVALDDDQRVIELSRMLSGTPDSNAANAHAAELLSTAAADRGAR